MLNEPATRTSSIDSLASLGPSAKASQFKLLPWIACLALGACGDAEPEQLSTPPSAATWLAQPRAFAREVDATSVQGGEIWTTFLSKRSVIGEVDSVSLVLRVRNAAGKSFEATLARGANLAAPTIAAFPGGAYVAWEDEWESAPCLKGIVVTFNAETGQLTPSRGEIICHDVPSLMPDLCSLPDGGLALAWQALVGTNYELMASRLSNPLKGNAKWAPPVRLTTNKADEWCPSIVATGSAEQTKLHIAFDRFVPGGPNGFDIVHLELDLGGGNGDLQQAPTVETLVATGPNYQAYASIAAQPQSESSAPGEATVWIAYEEAPQFGEYDALRSRRTTRLAKVTTSSGPTNIAHAILPQLFQVAQRGDFPKVSIGETGLALTRRIPNNDFDPINSARAAFFSTWRTHVTTFNAQGRAIDVALGETDGDNFNDSALVPTATGFELVFTTDARSESFEASRAFDSVIERTWHLGQITIPSQDSGQPGFPDTIPGPAVPVIETESTRAPGLGFRERQDTEFFGDLHRHTHLSRCAGIQDGTFLDSVRYSRGPGALDFLSVTDHYQHLTGPSWWRSKRDADRWNAPGSLIVFPGIERNVPSQGHQNLIWQDTSVIATMERSASPIQFAPGQVIAIPHMSSLPENKFNWPAFDPERHRLVEIHQGLRGSYEGKQLPLAASSNGAPAGQVIKLAESLGKLKAAKLPGMISSADHGTSSNGFAGVHLATGQVPTRASLYQAMVAGQTYATTGPPPGKDTSPNQLRIETRDGTLHVEATAGALAYIEIVRNGVTYGRMDGGAFHGTLFDGDDAVENLARVLLRPTLVERTGMPMTIELLQDGKEFIPGESDFAFTDVRLRRDIGNGVTFNHKAPARLEMVLPHHVRTTAAISFTIPKQCTLRLSYGTNTIKWNPQNATAGQSKRRAFGPEPKRPMVDFTLMGYGHQGQDADSGLFEASYEGELEEGVYYARAVWLDGNMAWSRFVRHSKP